MHDFLDTFISKLKFLKILINNLRLNFSTPISVFTLISKFN